MDPWKKRFLLKIIIFSFYVKFQACMSFTLLKDGGPQKERIFQPSIFRGELLVSGRGSSIILSSPAQNEARNIIAYYTIYIYIYIYVYYEYIYIYLMYIIYIYVYIHYNILINTNTV